VRVAFPGVLVGVARVGVPAVIVETGNTTLVEFGCTCGDGVAFGGCIAMGVGAEVGSGVGVGVGVEVEVGVGVGVGVGVEVEVGGGQSKIHPELIGWATATPVIPLNIDSKSA
jgi:hypothetical protein